MVVTDIGLLLFMLVGLLRVRIHGGGMFALTRFLWRQVWLRFLLALVLSINMYSLRVSFGSLLPQSLRFHQ